MKMNSKKLALSGILLALALIIGMIENLIPPIIPMLPFVKIGLSNIVIMFCAIVVGFTPALIITCFKATLVPLFVGNPMMIAYSLTASLVSLLIVFILLKTKKIGIPTISLISAIIHNIMQLIVASIIMESSYVFGFLPYLILTGFISGFVTGIITHLLIKFLPKEIVILN